MERLENNIQNYLKMRSARSGKEDVHECWIRRMVPTFWLPNQQPIPKPNFSNLVHLCL